MGRLAELVFIFIFIGIPLWSHDGHQELASSGTHFWLEWIGSWHLCFLHFPIALINMLAVSEILFSYSRRPMFEASSCFLLFSITFLTPITALLGWVYSLSATYQGDLQEHFFWHMWFGIFTALLAIGVLYIRYYHSRKLYITSVVLLVIAVNATGLLGSKLAA